MALNPGKLVKSEAETAEHAELIQALNLIPHVEGGYFAETDRAVDTMPNPYAEAGSTDTTRNLSTLIYYLLTRYTPAGHFHRNKSRTTHLLHRGRAVYVLIYPDGRVETFVAGADVAKGEKLQWIVDGGIYKASFLPPGSDECLISEVVVPGFDFADHDFMASRDHLVALAGEEEAAKWDWLLRKD
ncbi:RmlC-like cupin domain-containing protein [Dipodascopsis tothii]|uniref:RmlC-like cupin domain-containing protein n=1 Tax=Dipodascopsis tothii TaxID=44089 RepID=UPI0034CEFB29